MTTFACINWRNYQGRGADHVNRLAAMVSRHMDRQTYRFQCFTDDPGGLSERVEVRPLPAPALIGWWHKISMLKPGVFAAGERVVFLDLDSVIVGPLAPLADGPGGIIYLRDWGWTRDVYCSSTMVWTAGEHEEVWTKFRPDVPRRFEGDQDWITHLGGWGRLPAHQCRSYRYHSTKAPPAGCSVVAFHGQPKPAQVTTGWVPQFWRE